MSPKPEVLDRLLLSKSFLDRIRFQPVAVHDRHTLAANIITAHDAAELAIAAIADELGAAPTNGGKTYLMDYFEPIEKKTGVGVHGRDYLRQLNGVRAMLKHQGLYPDAKQWGGRFMQADPFTVTSGRIADPQQFNLYVYVRNNPLRHIDPTGMLIDDSQLSDKDKEKWRKVQDIANQKDQNGNYLHPELHSIVDKLESDSRTFVLENSKLGSGTGGVFTITNMSADGKDFTKATLQIDFKQIQGISNVTGADLVPGFNKYQGLLDAPIDRLAETFGHEGAHGVFSIQNPAQAVGVQQLLNQRDAAMEGQRFPYPPDVMQKIDAAEKALVPTERYAQQVEKIINGELQADKKKQ